MTDIAFSSFFVSCGALSLLLRFVHGRWSYVLLPLLLATLAWGFAVLVFRVKLLAPVGQLTDIAMVSAGLVMLFANAFLDFRARAAARKMTEVEPQ